MERLSRVVLNLIFCIQVFLLFLLFAENRIDLPAWLQVAGRMHPLVLHLPIGAIVFLVVLMLVQKDNDKVVTHHVIHIGLLLTSLSASAAALFGFFLSLQSDYGPEVLARHKISGVLLSFLCYAALLLHNAAKKKSIFFGIGILSCLVLVFTGHTGAVLTHGDNFLLAPISKSKIVLTADNASVYKYAVEPILERKCFTCHNESKAKGGLIMTSVDKFKAGGENGKPWVEGDPSASRMIKAFYLPLSEEAHMPPDGKPQLTRIEIAALKAWIKSGADFEKKLSQFDDGDSLKSMVAAIVAAQPPPPVEEQYTFEAASEYVVKNLNTPFRTVLPLYQNSPALQVDFFVRKSFEKKALDELSVIKDQLVVLNLSKMPVEDKDLSTIKLFVNLEYLNLNFSAIKGDGLAELGGLKNLKSIALAGTAIGAGSLGYILSLPNLRDVFVWSTKISDTQLDSLSTLYPKVSIINSQFNDESILKLSKPILDNEGVVQSNADIRLKHPMPGVAIRYTLDGSEPDTLKGLVYDHPLKFSETTVIKARACKESWYCSGVYEVTCFVAGLNPTQVELLTQPDPRYRGQGQASLVDRRKGVPDVLQEPSWLGYRNEPFVAGISFAGQTATVKQIVLSYGKNIGAFCFPPEEVEVWAGENKNELRLIKRLKPDQPAGNEPQGVRALFIPLEPASYSYYKVVAKPVAKLPAWHNGKGQKGWVFIDEIFVY